MKIVGKCLLPTNVRQTCSNPTTGILICIQSQVSSSGTSSESNFQNETRILAKMSIRAFIVCITQKEQKVSSRQRQQQCYQGLSSEMQAKTHLLNNYQEMASSVRNIFQERTSKNKNAGLCFRKYIFVNSGSAYFPHFINFLLGEIR